MQIRVQCPACEATFEVPTALVGRDGECSRCKKVFRVTPLSGEVDASVLTSGDSAATLEVPIVDEDRPAADTDEFEIPDIPAPSPQVEEASTPQLDVPELDVPELNIPELDVPAAPRSEAKPTSGKKKESAAEIPLLDDEAESASKDEPPPILIEDDGSLFGDELPELEKVREPVSQYAAEDEEDSDAGGSYSLSGSSPASDSSAVPEKRKAKKARRKKPTKKKTSARRRSRPDATEGDSRATSDHDLEAAEVQLFDDVLHDDDEDGSGPNSAPVMLRRSGTFSTPSKSNSGSEGKSGESTRRKSEKRPRRKPAARTKQPESDSGGSNRKPVLKRRSSEESPAAKHSESRAPSSPAETNPAPRERKKSTPMSAESQQKLIKLVGGGAALLALAGLFSYLTSGPPVITPTVQVGGNSTSNQSSGPAPVPNQDGDSIQTGETKSSVARAHRTREAGGPPRRSDGPRRKTGDATAESTMSDGTTGQGSGTPGVEIPEGSVVVAVDGNGDSTGNEFANLQTDDDQLFPIEAVAIPNFPNLGTSKASTIAGAVYHEIAIGNSGRIQAEDEEPSPGSQMDMILYLPNGTHDRGSLPCVMIAAAGTTMLEGNGCYDESYQSETIPYVKQGFAVLGYSLDGPLASDSPSKRESKEAYEQFRAAHAGLVNSRNALEFLLQKVPAIDREKIFTAGHSSAGTLSLLFAEHESRLAGCIAYAPCVDVETRLSDFVSNPLVEALMPGVEQFVRQESPLRHYKSLKCPVFLFHAEGDTNAPFEESQKLAALLTAEGIPCELKSVPGGDHYNSMLEEGIPGGIEWLKNTALGQPSESPAASDSTTE